MYVWGEQLTKMLHAIYESVDWNSIFDAASMFRHSFDSISEGCCLVGAPYTIHVSNGVADVQSSIKDHGK